MTEQQWQRVKLAFEETSDRSPEDRLPILSDLDLDTRLQVERMLSSYDSDRNSGVTSFPGLPGPGFWSRVIQGEHTFEAGQLLIGRFEVLSFLGAGGMGEVFHARDRQLGEVAIKTLRIEFSNLSPTLERFRREVSRGRQVSHPNVCRIHDLFEADSPAGVPFFTMEYLPGQTLSAFIRSGGPISAVEALPIALDLCAGLGAAHEARIIHGDFKAANIMLSLDSAAPWQVKIMDFGLADILPSGDSKSEPARATLAGTRPYLAPELLSGGTPTIASDIFALGVVLHQMRLATYPFREDASAQERNSSPQFERLAQSLEAPWARAIAACLDSDPAKRPASTLAAGKLLRGEVPDSSSRRVWLGSVLAGGGATACLAYWWRNRSGTLASLLPPNGKLKVLTEEFSAINLSPAYGRALTNLLRLCLRSSPLLIPVLAQEVSRTLVSLGRETQPLRGPTAQAVAISTASGLVLSGSIRSQGEFLLIDCKAKSTATGDFVWSPQPIQVERKNLPQAASILAASLGKAFGDAAGHTQIAGIQLEQADSSEPDALEQFSLALSYFALGEFQPALKALADAQRIDSNFALAYLLMAQIYATLHREDLALPPLEKAHALRSNLNARHRNHIEYLYFLLHGDYSRAHDQIHSMVQLYSDDVGYLRGYAHSCALLGKSGLGLDSARQAYRLDQENPMAVNSFASALAESGSFQEARQLLALSLATKGQSTPALYAKAYVHLLDLDFPTAIGVLEELSSRVRPAVLVNYQLVKAKILSGSFDLARIDLERDLLSLDQSGELTMATVYRYWLGQIALLFSDFATASRQADALSRVAPQDQFLSALRSGAELAWLSGNRDALRTISAKLGQIHARYSSSRSSSFCHFAAGTQHAIKSNWTEAANEFLQARALWPDIVNNWASGEALLAAAKPALAADHFEQVVAAKSSAIRFDNCVLWVRSLARLSDINKSVLARNQFERLWGSPSRYSFFGSSSN